MKIPMLVSSLPCAVFDLMTTVARANGVNVAEIFVHDSRNDEFLDTSELVSKEDIAFLTFKRRTDKVGAPAKSVKATANIQF